MFPSRFGIHQPCAAPAQNLARNDATKSSTWLKRPPEFERPLGPPTGKAQREGSIYTRDFRQASVWLDIKNEQARITWH